MCKRTQQLMLSYCVRLHVAKSFDRFQTLRNKIQQLATGCAKGQNL